MKVMIRTRGVLQIRKVNTMELAAQRHRQLHELKIPGATQDKTT